jgi:K+-sensing histidine kinase KdpD
MENSVKGEKEDQPKDSVLTGMRAYLLASLCVGVALLLRMILDPLWRDRLPLGFFFIAVIIVTQFADVGPTVFAMVAGCLLADWFFLPPRHSFLISDPLNQFNAFLYFVVCFGVLFLSARMRRALAREQAARAALQKALDEVKTLSGLFPICAFCKKIRDDKGYWNQIELYIRDHSSANFTHSICPECAKDNYADFYKNEPKSG